jgi:dienelactone hydrolase
MAEILLLHHAHGLTTGMRDLAGTFERAGHTVHLPDLYEGRTFDALEDGVAHARDTGFDVVLERGVRAAEGLPDGLVYAGFSLGVMAAQRLAQTRPGARGALLVAACLPPAEFGGDWPAGVPVQVHGKESDPYFAGDGDLAAARELVASVPDAELFLYPGKEHIFTEPGLSEYDAAAAAAFTERALAFLDRVG